MVLVAEESEVTEGCERIEAVRELWVDEEVLEEGEWEVEEEEEVEDEGGG